GLQRHPCATRQLRQRQPRHRGDSPRRHYGLRLRAVFELLVPGWSRANAVLIMSHRNTHTHFTHRCLPSWPWLGALAALAAIPFACKEEPPGDTSSSTDGTLGSGGTGGAGGGATSGPPLPVGGGPNIQVDAGQGGFDNTGLGGGGAGGERSCAGEEHAAELLPLDVFIMLDRSLSMNAATGTGSSKWQAITSALEAFVADPDS